MLNRIYNQPEEWIPPTTEGHTFFLQPGFVQKDSLYYVFLNLMTIGTREGVQGFYVAPVSTIYKTVEYDKMDAEELVDFLGAVVESEFDNDPEKVLIAIHKYRRSSEIKSLKQTIQNAQNRLDILTQNTRTKSR